MTCLVKEMTSRNVNKSICREHLKKEQEQRHKRDEVIRELKKPITESERGFLNFLAKQFKGK